MFPFGWRMQRRRGLRTWIVMMLERTPKNGAEIMNEIENTTQGWWRPSPGSVYPILDDLVRDGLIKKRDDGRYEATSKAREEFDWPFGGGRRPQSVDDMISEIKGYVSYFEDLARTDRSKVDTQRDSINEIVTRLTALVR